MATTLRKDIERLEKELAHLSSQLVEAEQLLRNNESALLQAGGKETRALTQPQTEAAESKRQIEALQAVLNEKTAAIDRLTEQLATADQAGREWQSQVEALQCQLEDQAEARGVLEKKPTAAEE